MPGIDFPLLCRHSLRDLRGGARYFRLFFVCLLLGVAVMAAVGSMVSGLKAGIDSNAKALFGGDVELQQLYRPIPDEAITWLLFHSRNLSRSMTMRAMAEQGGQRTLVELKGVDGYYPLYGELALHRASNKPVFFSNPKRRLYGAAVDQNFLDMLHLKPGQHFMLGQADCIITAIIESEPDRSFNGLTLGPRVMVSLDAFPATGLLQFGSLVHYHYQVQLPEGTDLTAWKRDLTSAFPDTHWSVRDWRDNSPGMVNMIDRLSLFFALTGITTLIVAGIGISNATNVYLWGKRQTIATLKCIGASERYVQRMYLLQLLVVGALAICSGLIVGAAAEMLLLPWLDDLLPVHGERGIYPRPLALSAALGMLTVLLFSLLPLLRSSTIKPASLFRGTADMAAMPWRQIGAPVWRGGVVLIVLMLMLAILFTGTVKIPLYFAIGLAVSLAILVGISQALQRFARHAAHNRRYRLSVSMALANLARPGAATTSMVIALGIGMCLLVALTLVAANLKQQVEEGLPEHAPAFFLIDVQPSELAPLQSKLAAIHGIGEVTSLPMIRGRISAINGVPTEQAVVAESARWALRGDRGLTYAAKPPAHAHIVAGEWWKADYNGPPLVSFDANLAHGMGLKLGDTITISALDKDITATISNLRDIQWGSLEMNFAIILSPGALGDLPTTYLTIVTVPRTGEKDVQAMLSADFPTVAVVRVRDVLGKIAVMLRGMSRAVLATSGVTIACGILVMASAVHASLHKRVFDTVMLKVLGVTRRKILTIYLLEFTFLTAAVAVVSVIIGALAAYGIMQLMIFSQFTLPPLVVVLTLAGSMALALILGLAATHITLSVRPLHLLRNE